MDARFSATVSHFCTVLQTCAINRSVYLVNLAKCVVNRSVYLVNWANCGLNRSVYLVNWTDCGLIRPVYQVNCTKVGPRKVGNKRQRRQTCPKTTAIVHKSWPEEGGQQTKMSQNHHACAQKLARGRRATNGKVVISPGNLNSIRSAPPKH